MSHQPLLHSPALKRLIDEGFNVAILSGHLVVSDVPYVTADRVIKRGQLIFKLTVAGDQITVPSDHVAYFIGDYPGNTDGSPILSIKNPSLPFVLADGLTVQHTFSAKPHPAGNYADYYSKITTYVAILAGPAQRIDPTAKAQTFPVLSPDTNDSVFNYVDTASSRAGITSLSSLLELDHVAIVGLGGTGSYVLDLVAKTPVNALHLFDGDEFVNHNAFRSPGAASLDELRQKQQKVDYLKAEYSKMHRNIIAHDTYIDASNVGELRQMKFVFLCLDRGEDKRPVVTKLQEWNIPFVDVGMGVNFVNDALMGILRVTTSTAEQKAHIWDKQRIPFTDGDGENEYSSNIQIADLNAFNAALAVIKWKKLFGFYHDLEHEHYTTYTVTGNNIINGDQFDA